MNSLKNFLVLSVRTDKHSWVSRNSFAHHKAYRGSGVVAVVILNLSQDGDVHDLAVLPPGPIK